LLSYRTYLHPNSTEWVVFIHGIGGNSGTFSLQLKAFTSQFNVLIPDLRGHGLSKEMSRDELDSYTLEIITNDIFQLMDHLDIAMASFVGCSFGATIIRLMEMAHPERFKSIVLAGAVLKINLGLFVILHFGKLLSPYINNHFLYATIAYFIMPRKNHIKARKMFIDASKDIPRREYRAWLYILRNLKYRLDNLFNFPFNTKRVLLISGDQDHVFLPSCREFNRRFPETRLEIIENCGHVSSIEKYNEFNELAIEFIKESYK
jgi:pimeloyl-ACP methyl ester carboxylesterase